VKTFPAKKEERWQAKSEILTRILNRLPEWEARMLLLEMLTEDRITENRNSIFSDAL